MRYHRLGNSGLKVSVVGSRVVPAGSMQLARVFWRLATRSHDLGAEHNEGLALYHLAQVELAWSKTSESKDFMRQAKAKLHRLSIEGKELRSASL